VKTAAAEPKSPWTAEQCAAIQMRDVSVALSAGAGCGKTFVLTERFLAHFESANPQSPPADELAHVVAITFTERAAREMRDRIRSKCHERLRSAADADAQYWADLLRGLDSARISTIHSFCGALLRSRAVEAGLDPQFEVLEQAQADTLLSEAIDDDLRAWVAAHDENVLNLAARFGLGALSDMLRRLVLECERDELTKWLEISPVEQVALWESFHRDAVLPAIAEQIADSPAAQAVLRILTHHIPTNPTMQARRAVLLDTLGTLKQTVDGRKLTTALEAIRAHAKVQGGGTAKAWESAEAYDDFKQAATELRERIDRVLPLAAFDPQSALVSADVARQLLEMADRVERSYSERKRALGVLDFNDLLTRARRLLIDPAHRDLKSRLSSQIHLLLVDEFQDTDPTQVELVVALCDEIVAPGKLFFVGDFKQSIYRFRGADPGVFLKLREKTATRGKLSLTKNFRSQPAVLEFVNALFWTELGEKYEPLRPARQQVTAVPAVEFLWVPQVEEKEKKGVSRQREADWIARRIRALLDGGQPIVWDADAAKAGKPAARAAQPGDIALLFRALSDVELYEEALRRQGIDYYLVGGHAFYAQQEIFDVLNLLRTLNSPSDAVSLVGVLRSGFFSLADETIFWLAQHSAGLSGGLYGDYPVEISAEEQGRARFAATTLAELRDSKDRLRICELIDEALARTGYDAALLNEFLGERKLANLRKLVEQARSFDRDGFFALPDFVAQLTQFVAGQPDEPLAATHSENTNVVRLMTIHQSKGLEFPIVIVPDLDRPTHNRSRPVKFDAQLGPLVKMPKDDGSMGGYELWNILETKADLAELGRLLYVATTRAADYLILSSGVAQLGAASGPWTRLLARRFDLVTGRLIGDLPADEPRPQIRVIAEEPAMQRAAASRRAKVDLDKLLDEVAGWQDAAPERLSAIDPIAPDLGARRQYSFSRLAGTVHPQPEYSEPFDFAAPSPIDPRGLGTLVHGVLAAVEFGRAVDCRALVRLHAERNLSSGSAEADEAVQMVERFLASARASELAAAIECHAEIEFLLSWPPSAGSRDIVLNGVIDRLYRDPAGSWHVLDFKTNRLGRSPLAQQSAAYEMQMLVYALASERILGSSPRSLTLHFLRTGAEHQFVWNDDARARVVHLVNEGITAAAQPKRPLV
jgi:ATP-dependent helicase/nuclease subunit A